MTAAAAAAAARERHDDVDRPRLLHQLTPAAPSLQMTTVNPLTVHRYYSAS